jgi:hypothetical protein
MRRFSSLAASLVVLSAALLSGFDSAHAEAYDAKPKLVVIVVIDQFRGDYLERYRSELKGRGFRLFLDEGAWFPDCYYNYANTKTAPGHATIGTGAYTDGHGIEANEFWDASRSFDHKVSAVEDDRYTVVDQPAGEAPKGGASPRSLRASTLGDELRLATQGRSRVFGPQAPQPTAHSGSTPATVSSPPRPTTCNICPNGLEHLMPAGAWPKP